MAIPLVTLAVMPPSDSLLRATPGGASANNALYQFWFSLWIEPASRRHRLGEYQLKLEAYAALRPMLYHCTAKSNLARIRVAHALHSVTILAPGRQLMRRLDDEVVEYDDQIITLRDQRALHSGHVRFTGSASWNDVVAANNSRVFFWPGTQDGPIRHGHRFWEKYRVRPDIMLRIGFEELRQVNLGVLPYFWQIQFWRATYRAGTKEPAWSRSCWPTIADEVIE